MRTHPLTTASLAVAAAVTVLLALATPAAADTGTLTPGGEILVHNEGQAASPIYDFDVPGEGGGEDPCDPDLPEGQVTMTSSGTNTSGTWTASTPTPIKAKFTSPSTTVYQVDLNILTASGTYTTTGAPAGYTHALSSSAPNHAIFQAKFYRISPPNCAKTDLRCTLNVRLLLRPGSGFNGTLPGAASPETAKLVITSDVAGGLPLTPVGACDSDLSSVSGKDVTSTLFIAFS